MKQCNRCFKELEEGNFYKGRAACKRCVLDLSKINESKESTKNKRREYRQKYKELQKEKFSNCDQNKEKHCHWCLKIKTIKDFYRLASNKCKECVQKKIKEYANDPANKEKIDKYQKEYKGKSGPGFLARLSKRQIASTFILNIKNKTPCKDCQKIYHPACMEFDHIDRKNKKKDISYMVNSGYKLDEIKIEVAKCELVCANCHRIRTVKSNIYNSSYPQD